jgi:hypothetical protein
MGGGSENPPNSGLFLQISPFETSAAGADNQKRLTMEWTGSREAGLLTFHQCRSRTRSSQPSGAEESSSRISRSSVK